MWQAQLRALLAGEVQAQHQNNSHTLEPLVSVDPAAVGGSGAGTGKGAITMIRRPVAGGAGSSGAAAWVSSPWTEGGVSVRGAVIEFS